MLPNNIKFVPSKPFYPLVSAYLIQVHGLIEMASRGMKLRFPKVLPSQVEGMFKGNQDAKTVMALEKLFATDVTALIGKQSLEANTGLPVEVDVDGLALAFAKDSVATLNFYNRMTAGSLLITAWELTDAYHTKDSLWEFFRHCRNAAAHKGYFNFLGNEPKNPASWRGLQITSSLQGTPLFFDPPVKGFLGTGDVIYLLAEIEQNYPNLS